MTDEREQQIKKDLLWEYTKALTALEAFRVKFRDLADSLTLTVKTLRDHPEDLADFSPSELQTEFETAVVSAKEYREMLAKNAERKASLTTMGVHQTSPIIESKKRGPYKKT